MYYWKIKTFKSKESMSKWLAKNEHKIQWVEVFVNNGYAVEYRRLRRIY